MPRNDICSADLGNGRYRNPIVKGNNPDPSVVRVGGDYYLATMSGRQVPGLPVWHSTDLVDWEPLCRAGDFPGDVDLWAPDIAFHDGRFYLYCISNEGILWGLSAERPEGPWSRPRRIMYMTDGHIDPVHCVDGSGDRFLSLSNGYVMPLAADGLESAGPPAKVYDGWRFPEEWSVEGFCLESDKIVRRNGMLHLVVAQGGTWGPSTSHMVVSARSRSLSGPWENSPYNPVLRTVSRDEEWHSVGHGALIDTPDGDWYMLFHGVRKGYATLGRQLLMLPVEWTPDGWFRVPEGMNAGDDIPLPRLPRVRRIFTMDDDFEGRELGPAWSFPDRIDRNALRFREPGLALGGRGRNASESVKLVCNALDTAYTVEASVTLSGSAEGGILLYYDERCFCGFGVGPSGYRSYNRACSGDLDRLSGLVPGAGRPVRFRIVNDRHEVSGFFRTGDGGWRKFPGTFETSGFHHNNFGGFGALRICLYAAGRGEALFTSFRYAGS